MKVFTLVLTALFWLSACALTDRAPSDARPDADVNTATARPNVELLRNTVAYSFKPFATLRDMFESGDIAVVGRIVSVETALVAGELEPSGAVIVGIEPTRELKRAYGAPGETVYYWIDRPSNLGREIYLEALPMGTEVVLFGLNAKLSSDVKFTTPTPPLVFAPLPQGLFLGASGHPLVNVWGEDRTGWGEVDTVPEIVDEITQ